MTSSEGNSNLYFLASLNAPISLDSVSSGLFIEQSEIQSFECSVLIDSYSCDQYNWSENQYVSGNGWVQTQVPVVQSNYMMWGGQRPY